MLAAVSTQLPDGARDFVGVTDPLDPRVETPEAARHLPPDSGFAPFADDQSTSVETAFVKIRARPEGTALAAEALGV
ncbi:hypothetical protein [Streptomyces johnsoniae]